MSKPNDFKIFFEDDGRKRVGELKISKNGLKFNGKADESAKLFFDKYLKEIVDEYIKEVLKKEE